MNIIVQLETDRLVRLRVFQNLTIVSAEVHWDDATVAKYSIGSFRTLRKVSGIRDIAAKPFCHEGRMNASESLKITNDGQAHYAENVDQLHFIVFSWEDGRNNFILRPLQPPTPFASIRERIGIIESTFDADQITAAEINSIPEIGFNQ